MDSQTVGIFSSKPYDKLAFPSVNPNFKIVHFDEQLNRQTARSAKNMPVVCCFVNDIVDEAVLRKLAKKGVKMIAMRCAGYDNVDLAVAKELGITVTRVPAYSPYATSEHALALMLTLNRKTHKAYNRTREGDYSINGLMGFDIHGKTAGIIGTGKIGSNLAKILLCGFECTVLAYDVYKDSKLEALGVKYVSLDELLGACDIISLHAPLTPETKHLINAETIAKMKQNVMIINTSRGGLLDTKAVIHGLKSKKIGHLGIDVYEKEKGLFFENKRDEIIDDDELQRLMTFPNVVVTAHQAFFTKEAVTNIAKQTIEAIESFVLGKDIKPEYLVK